MTVNDEQASYEMRVTVTLNGHEAKAGVAVPGKPRSLAEAISLALIFLDDDIPGGLEAYVAEDGRLPIDIRITELTPA